MEEKNSNIKPMKELQQTNTTQQNIMNEDLLQEAIKAHKQIVLLSDPEDAKEAQELYPGLFFTAPLTDDGLADEDLPDALEGAKVLIPHGKDEGSLQTIYQLCADLTGRAEEVKSALYNGLSFSEFLKTFKDETQLEGFIQNAIPYKTFKDVEKQAKTKGITIKEKTDLKGLMEIIKPEHYTNQPITPPEFLIPNFITTKGCCFFVGSSKIGKTTLLMNLLLCLSAGEEFLKFDDTFEPEDEITVSPYPYPPHLKPVRPFTVLFCSLENEDSDMRFKFSKLIEQLKIPKDKLPLILFRQELKKLFPNLQPIDAVKCILKRNLKDYQRGKAPKIEVVGFEPMYRLRIIDESKPEEVTELYQDVEQIGQEYDVKIISNAHTKKNFTLSETLPSEAISGSGASGRIGTEYFALEQHKDYDENHNVIMASEVRSSQKPKRRVIYFGRETDQFVYHTDPDANPFEGRLNKGGYKDKSTDTNPKGAGRKADEEATHEKALDALFMAMEYADFEPVQMKDWQDRFTGSNPTLKLRKADLLNKHCIKKVNKDKYCFNFDAIEEPGLPESWKKKLEEIKSKTPENKLDKAQGITKEKKSE